ncbi:MAG: MarR family transcriptional regulator [Myxococcota bacterium]
MSEALQNTLGALALALCDDVYEAFRDEDLVPSEAEAVGHIGHAPGMTIRDLSKAIALSHAATVRLVGRLEEKGVVTRAPCATDGRNVLLRLSRAGRRLHKTFLQRRRLRLRKALSVLSSDERGQFASLSNRILSEFVRSEDHAFRVCRLCDRPACSQCPVETEMIRRTSEVR